jgi:hypothetical protein
VLPPTAPGNFHVYNQFTVRAPKRDALRTFLKENPKIANELLKQVREKLKQG